VGRGRFGGAGGGRAGTPEGSERVGTVSLVGVAVLGYRNDNVLVSGPKAGEQVVTAGVQKMAPGLRVALPAAANDVEIKQAAR